MNDAMKHKLTARLRATVLAFAAAGLTVPVIAAPPRPYPLNICLITHTELGSMGKVVSKVHQGREVKFCCRPCLKKFDADPAKYLAKLK